MNLKKFTQTSFIVGMVLTFIPLFCYSVFPMPHNADSVILNSMCYMIIIGFVSTTISIVSFGIYMYLKYIHNNTTINIKIPDLDISDKLFIFKNKNNTIDLDKEIEYQRELLYKIEEAYKLNKISIIDCKRKSDIIQNRLETLIWLKERENNDDI
jgi:hypothetical protein